MKGIILLHPYIYQIKLCNLTEKDHSYEIDEHWALHPYIYQIKLCNRILFPFRAVSSCYIPTSIKSSSATCRLSAGTGYLHDVTSLHLSNQALQPYTSSTCQGSRHSYIPTSIKSSSATWDQGNCKILLCCYIPTSIKSSSATLYMINWASSTNRCYIPTSIKSSSATRIMQADRTKILGYIPTSIKSSSAT